MKDDLMSTSVTTRRGADLGMVLAIFIMAGMLTYLSVARYNNFTAGQLDLGNMAQAIWSGSQGRPLLYSWPDGYPVSRLSGHVELFYFALAPLYRLWPDPRVLLIAQAALFALGGIGAYRLALRRSGEPVAARCALLIYLFYPVAITGVLFDLHGDTLAMPLLMLALDALDERAWRRYAVFTMLALACKFYVAAPVALVGALMIWQGRRQAGAITLTLAFVYGLLAFTVVRPFFVTPDAAMAARESGGYIGYYFGQLDQIGATLGDRILNALIVFGPALLLAWRGWQWLLPAAPIAAAALLSTGPGGAFDYRYHHYALVVPFVVMATIEGALAMRAKTAGKRGGRTWRGDMILTTVIVVLCAALLTNIPLNPLFWLRIPEYGLHPSSYGVTARDRLADAFLAERVPEAVPVAASNFLAPHLVNRDTLYLLRYPDEGAGPERLPKLLPQVQVAVADALFDYYRQIDEATYAGGVDGDRQAIAILLGDRDFALTHMRDGLLVFERGATGGLANRLNSAPASATTPQARFGQAIELVNGQAEALGNGRARLTFTWRVAGGFGGERYVAVSRLQGVEGARFVHLPGYALRPAWQWQPGQVMQEQFEIELPAGLAAGRYDIQTGWYDITSPFAAQTDARSLLPGSQEIRTATLALP